MEEKIIKRLTVATIIVLTFTILVAYHNAQTAQTENTVTIEKVG